MLKTELSIYSRVDTLRDPRLQGSSRPFGRLYIQSLSAVLREGLRSKELLTILILETYSRSAGSIRPRYRCFVPARQRPPPMRSDPLLPRPRPWPYRNLPPLPPLGRHDPP